MAHLPPRPRCGAILLLAAAIAAGCASKQPTLPPQEAYRQAVAEAQKGHYGEAQRLFESVRDADTPVRLELLAEVGIADALYKDGKFEEAAEAYTKLLAIHSGDAIADYLNYQLGMCYYRRIDTVDRDQGLTRQARSQFMALISRYPESDLQPAAREKVVACNDYLARRELYVGHFYLGRDNYEAAKRRFIRGLTQYGETAVVPDLLHGLCLAEDGLGDPAAARAAADRLRHDFPGAEVTQTLDDDRARAETRRVSATTAGRVHRMGEWLKGGHAPPAAATAPPGATPTPEPAPTGESPAGESPATPPAGVEAPRATGGGGAALDPSAKVRIAGRALAAPSPAAASPGVSQPMAEPAVATTETLSRWRPLVDWLNHRGSPPVVAAVEEPAPVSGSIVRHMAPMGAATPPMTETTPTPTESPVDATATVSEIPAVAPAAGEEPHVPPPTQAAVRRAGGGGGAPPGGVRRPLPATVTYPPPANPAGRSLTPKASGGELQVEEFPAVEEEVGAPTTASPRPLGERVEEGFDVRRASLPAGSTTPRLPAPVGPTPKRLVASGAALRHELPRPLPQPTFTRPTPPLPGESLPPPITGSAKGVEWHAMALPAAAATPNDRGVAPATAVAKEGGATLPAAPEGSFWSDIRERFTAAAAE